jgi:hypothetical protein
MPFEGPKIHVEVRYTVAISKNFESVEAQIANIEEALRQQFRKQSDLLIKVQKVDVYSADHSEGITR